jgi:hypothetical protein
MLPWEMHCSKSVKNLTQFTELDRWVSRTITFCHWLVWHSDCLTDWKSFDNSLGNFLITTQWWRQLLLSYNVQSMYNYVTNFYSPQTFSQECVFAVYGGKQNWLSHWAIKYCMSESLCISEPVHSFSRDPLCICAYLCLLVVLTGNLSVLTCLDIVSSVLFLVLDLRLDIVLSLTSLSWIFALTMSQVCFLILDFDLDLDLRNLLGPEF